MDFYAFVLMAVTCLLAALANIRLSILLAEKKWKVSNETGIFMVIVTTVAAICTGIMGSFWAFKFGGPSSGHFYMLCAVIAAIPMVGVLYLFIVGIIKTFERMLLGLCSKMS